MAKMVTELIGPFSRAVVSDGIFGFQNKSYVNLQSSIRFPSSLVIPTSRILRNPPSFSVKDVIFRRIHSFKHFHSNLSHLAVRQSLDWQQKRCFSGDQMEMPKSLPDGNAGTRMSHVDRQDAQKALLDYLHGTRGLPFADAEHMSKNSPVFLKSLLTKLENEGRGRSLTRFLLYHPINEFEPFLESLGLNPSELQPLLPRDIFFLSDDDILLENYHALCNYGVPRSKIGKMYKEGPEMFRYDYGVLALKLQAYEKLGLSKPAIIKLIVCCPTLLVGDLNLGFLQVLNEMKSLGINLDWIRDCVSDKSIYNWTRVLQIVNFLLEIGCKKKELAVLIKKHPKFVFDDSGKKTYELVVVLLKLGLKMNDIVILFVRYPRILLGNFIKNLWQSVHFLFEIGMDTEDIARIVSSHAQVLGSCSCHRPETVLANCKVTTKSLCDIIRKEPSQFNKLVSRKKMSILSLSKFDGIFHYEKTEFLLKLGFVENSDEMVVALSKFRGRGDQLQERFDCIVNCGLDYHTVAEMIKLVPEILGQSTEVIENKIDYLLNHLGYPLEALVAFPSYLCYSMNNIKLRFSMYNWLKDQGITTPIRNRKMAKSMVALSTILACSESRFQKYVVGLHPKGPEVWEKMKNSSSSS